MKPFVIAVANRKGGTGKSTTAVNLAAGLAQAGSRVLLVDLDTQGHAGLGFNIVASRDQPSAHDIFEGGPAALRTAVRPTTCPLIDVAPANQMFRHPGPDVSPQLLAEALDLVDRSTHYQVVVIDTAPSLDALMVTALAAANGVIIPFLPHPLSAEGVRQFARVFFQVRLSSNPALRSVALLPVQANPHILLHRDTIASMRAEFGSGKVIGHIRTDIKLAESFAERRPIFDHAPGSRGAADYLDFVTALRKSWNFASPAH
jgi:chromosome partitioning protein